MNPPPSDKDLEIELINIGIIITVIIFGLWLFYLIYPVIAVISIIYTFYSLYIKGYIPRSAIEDIFSRIPNYIDYLQRLLSRRLNREKFEDRKQKAEFQQQNNHTDHKDLRSQSSRDPEHKLYSEQMDLDQFDNLGDGQFRQTSENQESVVRGIIDVAEQHSLIDYLHYFDEVVDSLRNIPLFSQWSAKVKPQSQ